jgi:hypothetical protein
MPDPKTLFQYETKNQINPEFFNALHQENKRLFLENIELKQNLEREEFLHKNLYRQWTELNARSLGRDRESTQSNLNESLWLKFYKYGFLTLLVVTVVLAITFFSNNKTSASENVTSATVQQGQPQKQSRPSPAGPALQGKGVKPEGSNKNLLLPSPQIASVSTGKYRVKTKTFFYNNPDETSKRSTYLLPYKDSYGVINALDDKNSFIYIVYVNHAGRTSKGWIRKTDLEQINP